ncbi:hypothetical protein BH708_00450 [Brachybacterium sp. P6-10-X1]|uniref:hypothetical protein n=1 Tax=Brachybacterium sp. P6-10-X1 TaxID=1903186 RepID=UPI000971A788|nr:hypothetical protein [Brachybacterium sp. P6-10-X1]APX31450.1 hypothetical protein BH708_00450 [Brachybacterium sp. P6-10-X1]
MFQQWRRRRAVKRIEPGDGSALRRFRWWQLLGRSMFHLDRPVPVEGPVRYTVDVRQWKTDENGTVMVHLYRDGLQHAVARAPALFPVEGGTIEVAASSFGLKRCHVVADDGTEHQLTPDPRSAEGRRARFEERRPVLSRVVGAVSIVALLVGVALLLQEIAVPILRIPPIAERIGTVEPLFRLPLWLTISLALAAALASTERALRLRYHWLLDAAGN